MIVITAALTEAAAAAANHNSSYYCLLLLLLLLLLYTNFNVWRVPSHFLSDDIDVLSLDSWQMRVHLLWTAAAAAIAFVTAEKSNFNTCWYIYICDPKILHTRTQINGNGGYVENKQPCKKSNRTTSSTTTKPTNSWISLHQFPPEIFYGMK